MQDKILNAARQCFRERGVRQTSVLDIVAAAGIGRSTFYRQFRDIDDILVTLSARLFIERLPALAVVLSSPGLAAGRRWRDFLAAIVELGQDADADDPLRAEDIALHVTRLYYGAYPDKRQQVIDALVPLIDAAKTAAELRTDVASERIAEWILRQTWVLSSLPMASQWSRAELDDYIETFVLPSLMRRDDAAAGPAVMQRLESGIERLAAVADRLEAQAAGAPPKSRPRGK